MKKAFCLIMALLCAVGAEARRASSRHEARLGKTYYSRVNIWYENPRNIRSTNFHRGAKIPAGTPVKIMAVRDPEITFLDEATGMMTLYHVRRHTRVTFDQYFDRMFAATSPKAAGTPYASFTAAEKAAIERGAVEPGMRREAVLMAYGYPPCHRTPDLDARRWTYWQDRRAVVQVDFNAEGRVASEAFGDPEPQETESLAFSPVGKRYYTAVNIWRENPDRIYSINYHVGPVIPVGTPVTIDAYGNDLIQFTVEGEEGGNTVVHLLRYSNVVLDVLFDRLFSAANVLAEDGAWHDLTPDEKQNVKNGTLALGMGKEAVLMAFGYPPGHRTPDLDHHIWTYWLARGERLVVYFRHDRIVSLDRP
jgi:hypothetical protein